MTEMTKNKILILALMFVFALLNDAQAKYQLESSSAIGEAKSHLEQLQRQLMRVEREARDELERTIAAQTNAAPKGEFETTKEYKARQKKAEELREQIEEKINAAKETRKNDLNRRINQLLVTEFNLPFNARLGAYDADTQKFPLVILPDNYQESVLVPRVEAKELKENFSTAEKMGTFALHLDSQNHAREYLVAGTITYRSRVYQIESKGMNVQRAMFVLYGNYYPVNNRAKWRGDKAVWEESEIEDQALEAIPIYSQKFRENNLDKFILVTGSVPEGQEDFDDCHACGAKIGLAIFVLKAGLWKMEIGQKNVGAYGSFGIPPKASLVRIGPDRYALEFSSGEMHQGQTDEGVDYLDRVNDVIKEILSLHTAEDSTAALGRPEDRTVFTSKIEYIPGRNTDYFDIKLVTRGKRGVKVGGKVIMRPFVEVKTYRFSNYAYHLSLGNQ